MTTARTTLTLTVASVLALAAALPAPAVTGEPSLTLRAVTMSEVGARSIGAGPAEMVDVLFPDGSTLTLAPGARVEIERYSFDRASVAGIFSLRVVAGTVKIAGGLLNELAPIAVGAGSDAVSLEAATAIIDVSGGATRAVLLNGAGLVLDGPGGRGRVFRPEFAASTGGGVRRLSRGELDALLDRLNPGLVSGIAPVVDDGRKAPEPKVTQPAPRQETPRPAPPPAKVVVPAAVKTAEIAREPEQDLEESCEQNPAQEKCVEEAEAQDIDEDIIAPGGVGPDLDLDLALAAGNEAFAIPGFVPSTDAAGNSSGNNQTDFVPLVQETPQGPTAALFFGSETFTVGTSPGDGIFGPGAPIQAQTLLNGDAVQYEFFTYFDFSSDQQPFISLTLGMIDENGQAFDDEFNPVGGIVFSTMPVADFALLGNGDALSDGPPFAALPDFALGSLFGGTFDFNAQLLITCQTPGCAATVEEQIAAFNADPDGVSVDPDDGTLDFGTVLDGFPEADRITAETRSAGTGTADASIFSTGFGLGEAPDPDFPVLTPTVTREADNFLFVEAKSPALPVGGGVTYFLGSIGGDTVTEVEDFTDFDFQTGSRYVFATGDLDEMGLDTLGPSVDGFFISAGLDSPGLFAGTAVTDMPGTDDTVRAFARAGTWTELGPGLGIESLFDTGLHVINPATGQQETVDSPFLHVDFGIETLKVDGEDRQVSTISTTIGAVDYALDPDDATELNAFASGRTVGSSRGLASEDGVTFSADQAASTFFSGGVVSSAAGGGNPRVTGTGRAGFFVFQNFGPQERSGIDLVPAPDGFGLAESDIGLEQPVGGEAGDDTNFGILRLSTGVTQTEVATGRGFAMQEGFATGIVEQAEVTGGEPVPLSVAPFVLSTTNFPVPQVNFRLVMPDLDSNTISGELTLLDALADDGENVIAFGGAGQSAFIDNKTFGARSGAMDTNGDGATDREIAVISGAIIAEQVPGNTEVPNLEPEHARWGFFLGEVGILTEGPNGTPVSQHVHMGTFATVGDRLDAGDIDHLQNKDKTFVFDGVIVGSVSEANAVSTQIGRYRETFNFGARTGTTQIDGFAGKAFAGTSAVAAGSDLYRSDFVDTGGDGLDGTAVGHFGRPAGGGHEELGLAAQFEIRDIATGGGDFFATGTVAADGVDTTPP